MSLQKSLNNFMKTNQRLAEKYHCKVSIQVPGEKEVVLADGREKKEPEKKGGRA